MKTERLELTMFEASESRYEGPSSVQQPGASGRSTRLLSGLGQNGVSALRALTQNLLRSLLTITGVVIGVVAIVTLVAILQGVKKEISRQVEGLGANLVLIVPSKLDENGQPNPASMIGISSLTEQDVDALQRTPGVARVSPVSIVAGSVDVKGGNTANAFVVATNRDGVRMNPTPMTEGGYFEDTAGNVCILGDKPRNDLFGKGRALGRTVRIQGHEWTVIGVLGRPQRDGTLG